MKNNPISSETLTKLTSQLEAKRDQLDAELSRFAKKDPHVQGDWDTTFPRTPGSNLEEAADEVEEYSTKLHVEFSLETQLKDINEALRRIQTKEYGICQTCTQRIAIERLMVSPEAATCGSCAHA